LDGGVGGVVDFVHDPVFGPLEDHCDEKLGYIVIC
jgi:hypothetical protein